MKEHIAVSVLVLGAACPTAWGTIIDLTTIDSFGSLNGALFVQSTSPRLGRAFFKLLSVLIQVAAKVMNRATTLQVDRFNMMKTTPQHSRTSCFDRPSRS